MAKKNLKEQKGMVKAERASGEKYILKLFVTGMLPNSAHAIINIKAICSKYLKDRHELEIIDIYQQPSLAFSEDIIAVPLLIKKAPLPEERLLGDLSDVEMVLRAIDLI
jgi:circadian clock protein KaiB